MSLTEKTSFSMRSYSLIALHYSHCVINFSLHMKLKRIWIKEALPRSLNQNESTAGKVSFEWVTPQIHPQAHKLEPVYTA